MTGYIKRVPLSTYRAQRRGGKGRTGMTTKDEDVVSELFVANTHAPVLFFTTRGMVYKLKVYRLPLGTPQSRGKAFVNLLPLVEGETISAILPLPEDETSWDQLHRDVRHLAGNVRRNRLSDFANIRANGMIAMKLDDGEQADRGAAPAPRAGRAAGHPRGQMHPLPRSRCARVRRPHLGRRARHQAG